MLLMTSPPLLFLERDKNPGCTAAVLNPTSWILMGGQYVSRLCRNPEHWGAFGDDSSFDAVRGLFASSVCVCCPGFLFPLSAPSLPSSQAGEREREGEGG